MRSRFSIHDILSSPMSRVTTGSHSPEARALPSFARLLAGIPAGQDPGPASLVALMPVGTNTGRLTTVAPSRHSLGAPLSPPRSQQRPVSYSGPSSSYPATTDPRHTRATTLSPGSMLQTFESGTMRPVPSGANTNHKYADSAPATPKSFVCGYCGRSFTRQSTYLTHENTHTEANSYICTYPVASGVVCGRTFTVPGNTYRHLRSKHGVKGGDVRDYVARQHVSEASLATEGFSDSESDNGTLHPSPSPTYNHNGGLRLQTHSYSRVD